MQFNVEGCLFFFFLILTVENEFMIIVFITVHSQVLSQCFSTHDNNIFTLSYVHCLC